MICHLTEYMLFMIDALTCDSVVCQDFYFGGAQVFCARLRFNDKSDFRLVFFKVLTGK